MKKFILLFIFAPVISFSQNYSQFVNPFIGTGGHGHTYPGATLPFAMVQLSPDTRLEGWDGCSGYHYSDSVIYGFSHTHLSGTGVPDYCDILFMPFYGFTEKEQYFCKSGFSHSDETASPGFYKVKLENGIEVELTSSLRAGFHKYIFPEGKNQSVYIDLKHRDKVLEADLKILSPNVVAGFRRSKSWAANQIVYFYAEFSKPIVNNHFFPEYDNIISTLYFGSDVSNELTVKVGISAVSIENAKLNMQTEIGTKTFQDVKQNAEKVWDDALSVIEVKGKSDEQKKIFYTALYHTLIVPNIYSDVDGSYLGRDFTVHKSDFDYYTVFSLWDTYRAAHPLYNLICPEKNVDFVRTMLKQYEQGGLLPVWELSSNETFCMIGYHSVPVLADAMQKGLKGFDYELAYDAMKNSANKNHFGIKNYIERGYISMKDEPESVSKTLEYAYDDWCIAATSALFENTGDYTNYIKRSQSYKNLFDPETGFMRARINGQWYSPFHPADVNFNYTEANSWQYSFYVPHDIITLMQYHGGRKGFEAKLDSLFTTSSETKGREQSDITGLIGQYAHGNEPSHHMAYLYNFCEKPEKTQFYVRKIMDEFYLNAPDGLIGNEDCGQMSAWYVFSAMGFYPVNPALNEYVIGSPLFDEVIIHFPGKDFTIKANYNSKENIYISSASLNGKEYNSSFINFFSITNGGNIEFNMTSTPGSIFGKGEFNIPFSEVTDSLITPVPFVKSGSRTFYDTVTFELGCLDKSAPIVFYPYFKEIDNSIRGFEYSEPVTYELSGVVKFFASFQNPSKSETYEFNKIPRNRSIKIKYPYSKNYTAGGDNALIDFIRGGSDFRTGEWQGYLGVDLDATIDLGEIQDVKKVSAGFTQHIPSWIFLPVKVSFEYSVDGISFTKFGEDSFSVDPQKTPDVTHDYSVNSDSPVKARYIRVLAENMKTLPEWHPGAGYRAWIFADEIVIEK